MEISRPVTGITLSEEEALISLNKISDTPGTASTLFTQLAQAAVNVDMIIQSAEENNRNTITYTVHEDDLNTAKTVTTSVAQELNAQNVTWDDSIAKISIVGVGMISKPGIAARMFSALGKNGINIKLISTSEIKISCAISRTDGKKALALLHTEFELDKKQ